MNPYTVKICHSPAQLGNRQRFLLPEGSLLLFLLTIWLNYMVKKKKDEGAEERILAAARKVFTTKGMAGARMQDIADEAGINKALVHYYFRDKDKLFETIFMEEAQKFFPKINAIFQSDDPLFEKIEKFVNEYIDEMQENPYLPWFVINEINRDPDRFMQNVLGNDNRPKPAKFLEQIEKEIKKGTIKRISPLHLLMNLLSMTIFPFVARPMITRNLRMSELQFKQAMEQRKKEVPKFIIDAIKK
jgi:TetR/AcrR family transcriptional regulator